jgi:hypothetical protein
MTGFFFGWQKPWGRMLKLNGTIMETKMNTIKQLVIITFFVMLSSSVIAADSNLITDDKGNTTGTIDGKKVKMHTDQHGNTKGTIGSARINTHTDQLGNTTGTVGKSIINSNIADINNPPSGMLGKSTLKPPPVPSKVTAGAINSSVLNSYTENPGNTSGKGGHRNINKGSGGSFDGNFGD